jgi:cytochrome c553
MKRMLLLAAVVSASYVAGALAQSPPAKPDLAKAQAIVKSVCVACHGMDGNSPTPINPNLAGMPAEYITLQLAHFKAGIRVNPVMQGMSASLSPEDMRLLGLYFSGQKPKGLAAKDASLLKQGQRLYRGGDTAAGIPACAGCHAPDGVGMPKNYPRLAGQYSDYTYAQLKAFKAGERGADKDGKDVNGRIMAAIAAKLTDAQMKALAEYTSGLH